MDLPQQTSRAFSVHGTTRAIACWILFFSALFGGCATFAPRPLDEDSIQRQAVSQTENGIRVSAAVLGSKQTEAVFGLQLYRKGIQPIWLKIENQTPHRMWFPQLSVDGSYFSPLEVAFMHHSGYTTAATKRMDRFFHRHSMHNIIEPGSICSGFVYTNMELGTKAFNVEVIGQDQKIRSFTFLIPVTDLKVDHREVDWASLYASREIAPLKDPHALRKAIEALPCCTSDADGNRMADPINIVLIGRGKDILYALLRSRWDETASASSYDPTSQLPWEFRYQPVKSLFLFKRPQDAAFRKSRSTLNERNQLRLWLSPYVYDGENVWVGQISRIVRRTVWNRFTIEPDVDEARAYLLQDLWYTQALSKYGYVRKSEVSTIHAPRTSLHDDHYFTDGLCLVAWVSSDPVPFSKVRFMAWERPVAERRNLLLGR